MKNILPSREEVEGRIINLDSSNEIRLRIVRCTKANKKCIDFDSSGQKYQYLNTTSITLWLKYSPSALITHIETQNICPYLLWLIRFTGKLGNLEIK